MSSSASAKRGQRLTRDSCDLCRNFALSNCSNGPRHRKLISHSGTKKMRCTGEHPACSRCLSTNKKCTYSTQSRMGRPKIAKAHRLPSNNLATSPSTNSYQLMPAIDTPTPSDNLEIRTLHLPQAPPSSHAQNSHTTTVIAPYHLDFEDVHCAGVQSNYPVTLGGHAMPKACACLSVQYLLLEQLGTKDRFVAPDDLTILRDSIQAAKQILQCDQCPTRYLFVIQNGGILGILCLCMAECYAKLLDDIKQERIRATSADEQKRLSFSSFGHDSLRRASQCEPMIAPVVLDVSPSEWEDFMRKTVKSDIFGVEGHRERCFMSLLNSLEERQRQWHQTPPAKDCPPMYRSACGPADRMPTCLMIVRDVRSLIDSLDL